MKILLSLLVCLQVLPLWGQVLVMETGQITIDHTVSQVTLNNAFLDPIVIATPVSYNGSHEASVRLRNISGTSFELFIEEPVNRDGPHTNETVHYVVIERGNYVFPDGTRLEAGTLADSSLSFRTQSFQQAYLAPPIVITQLQTTNSNTPYLHTRMRTTSATAFEVKLEREESLNSIPPNAGEEIGYFAIDRGTGILDSVIYEAGSLITDETPFTQNYTAPFSAGNHFIGGIASFNGSNPAILRWTNLNASSGTVFVDEDISNDSEENHLDETINYFVIDDNGGQGIFLHPPLGIELLDFELRKTNAQAVELRWTTSDNFESGDYFEVERSGNGSEWEFIGERDAPEQDLGNRLRFQLLDADPLPGSSFYRLRQIEKDGQVSFSPVREISFPDQIAVMSAYPNPVRGALFIKDEDPSALKIYDVAGKEMQVKVEGQGNGVWKVDVSDWAAGCYLVRSRGQQQMVVKE